ncbi:MAG: diguanylate cyclase (GGDEF)-like protein [Halioglobus sp.]|jgi:diguanylate cyclase (GGDEF)-like protein
MPDKKASAKTLPATLALASSVRLSGELSAASNGGLCLSSAWALDDVGLLANFEISVGESAVLNMGILRDKAGFIDNIDVLINEPVGTTLYLKFVDQEGDLEQRCLTLLSKSNSEDPAQDGNSDLSSYRPDDCLRDLQQQSVSQLEVLLKDYLIDLCNHLLDLSAKSKQVTSSDDVHYEAMNAVKKYGMKIISSVSVRINEHYKNLTPNKDSTKGSQNADGQLGNLNLVDIKEFEGDLAIARMIKTGEELYGTALECLIIRLADIIERDPHTVRLPMHVAQLCVAFQHAIEDQGIPERAMPDVMDFFGQRFIRRLEGYYGPLNEFLIKQGICPELEDEIAAKGSLLNRPGPIKKSRESNATENLSTEVVPVEPLRAKPKREQDTDAKQQKFAEEQASAIAGGVINKLNDRFSPDSLYQSVVDALNFKRDAVGGGTGAAIARAGKAAGGAQGQPQADSTNRPAGNPADASSIARVLGQMQQDATLRDAVQESPSLREYLANNQSDISGLEDTQGLSSDSLNQLDLVDTMFTSIKSQMDVTAELKPVLGNLQIPLAKLALLDPQFFVDRGHPARGVMDKLAQLTTAANFPNKVLEGRIERIVNNIVTDYETDSTVFDSALVEVNKLVSKQEQAVTRNVDRVVRTQEGNEKLRQAQQAVQEILAARIAPPSAPEVLVRLVESGWKDLLIITHIKEGPDGQLWKDHIRTLDTLIQWLGEQEEVGSDEEVLMQRSNEAEPLIDLIDQQISAALPTRVDHQRVLENLKDILAGKKPIEMTQVTEPESDDSLAPAEVRSKIENLPRLRRWIRKVEELKKGTWLTYRDKDGQKRRMQLAWVSDSKDRYIFVNERGQKIADLSSVQLARQLGRGVQPPPPSDKLSLVDRSMFETLEDVQKSLSFNKNHDTLTKLINKETFIDQLTRALRHAQRKHSQHAVLWLNIDNFALVNEVYDRVNGDQVLTEFARLLSQLHSKRSSSARLQSDEFAVLLLDRSLEQAKLYAEKIRSDIESSSVEIEGEKVTFTVSIGVAPVVDYYPEVEEILQGAHDAMKIAKGKGRNCVVVFEEDSQQAQTYQNLQAQAEAEIRQTIETDRFALRAQPIVQTKIESGSTVSQHYELLLALTEPDGTLTSPIKFIENAERYGYMTLVDRWVVKEAFSWISHLIDNQKVVPNISINLSGHSVTDDAFMEYLLEQISEFGVGTNRLCFEITETGTISNLIKAADFVRTFKNIGCKFSIDDFGTGMASHNYLRELPVDYVKIDGTFITSIDTNRNDYAMARSINDLAHFLGQETIAESVENDAIIACLQEIGVDYLQGWGISVPRLLSEITDELSTIEK